MESPGQQSEWPYCAHVQGTCLVYDIGRHLGESVRMALVDFIASAEEGARLTLQKNHNGFTVQVTAAVQRGREDRPTLMEARALRERLNSLSRSQKTIA